MIDHRPALCLFVLSAALAGAGCSLGTIGGIISPEESATGSGATGGLLQADMIGRWTLSAQGAGQCGMNFSGANGAREGAIAPEGGCPGRFFTSRKWAFEQSAVVIRNNVGDVLAQLSVADPNRLVGQTANGEQISLTR